MPKLNCFKKAKLTKQQDEFESLVSKGMSEQEAASKVGNEYFKEQQKEIIDGLNRIKKSQGIKQDAFVPFDNSGKIKEITDEYDKKINTPPPPPSPTKPPGSGTPITPPKQSDEPPIYNNEAIKTGETKTTQANIKPELTEEQKKYGAIGNDPTVAEAKRIVSSNPLEKVEQVTFDKKNDMDDALRRVTAIELAKAYHAQGDMESAQRVFGKYRELGTSAAQAIQAGVIASEDPLIQTLEIVAKNDKKNKEINDTPQPDGETTGKKLSDTQKEIEAIAKKFGVEVSETETLDTILTKVLAKGIPKSERLEIATKRVKDAGANLKAVWDKAKNVGIVFDPLSKAKEMIAIDNALREYVGSVINKTSIEIGEKAANLVAKITEQVRKFLGAIGMTVEQADLQAIIDDQMKAAADNRYTPPITQAEREAAVEKLKDLILNPKNKQGTNKPAIQEFYQRVIKRVGAIESVKKSGVDPLIEVTRNIDKYQDVLQGVKNELESEGIDVSDVNSLFDLPYFEKQIKNKVLIGDIKNLIKQHYGDRESAKQSISDKLIEQYGLTGQDAKAIEKIVNAEFNKKMKAAADKALTDLYGSSRLKQPKRKTKGDAEKIVEAINMGAFNNEFYTNLVGQRFGLVALTKEDISLMEDLAETLQTIPPGERRNNKLRAFNEHLNKIKNQDNRIKTLRDNIMSVWYDNALSGWSTQARSGKGNIISLVAGLYVMSASNPIAMFKGFNGLKAFYRGIKTNGFGTIGHIIKTGNNPFGEGNTMAPGLFQRIVNMPLKENLKNKEYGAFVGKLALKIPIAPIKYMVNSLSAFDAVFRYGFKETEAYIAAYNDLLNSGGNRTETSFWNQVNKDLANDDVSRQEAEAQLEYELADMKAKGEKIDLGYPARRLQEIIDGKRSEDIVKRSIEGANSRMLMSHPKNGVGFVYDVIDWALTINTPDEKYKDKTWYKNMRKAQLVANVALSWTLPFLKMASNQINRGISYTPIGLIHAGIAPGYTEKGQTRPMTAQERSDHFVMGGTGTIVIAALIASMFDLDDDDEIILDEDFPIRITGLGLGPGKFKENQDLDPNRVDLSIQFRNPFDKDAEWTKPISYKDSPIGMILYPLAQVSDDIRYKRFKKKAKGSDEEENDAYEYLATSLHWALQFATAATYQQSIRNLLDMMGYDERGDFSGKAIKAVTTPTKALYLPNLYKQTWQQIKSLNDMPDKKAFTLMEQMAKDVPLVEGIMENDTYDQLGYPIIKKFDWPLVPDMALDIFKENRDYRLTKPEWKLVFKYPEVTLGERFRAPDKIKGIDIFGKPTGSVKELTDADKDKFMQVAGTSLRSFIQKDLNSLNKLSAQDLQIKFNDYRKLAVEDANDHFNGGKFYRTINRLNKP